VRVGLQKNNFGLGWGEVGGMLNVINDEKRDFD
jgi:hypothetical protein